MQTNEVLVHTLFKGLDYYARALLSSVTCGQDLSRRSEEFFNLLDKHYKWNQGYEREMPRTTTQKTARISDVNKDTSINAKLY